MQDLFATNRRKSNFLHKYNITVIVKALLNEITRLAAHLDRQRNSTTLIETFEPRMKFYTTLNMLPKYYVSYSNHKEMRAMNIKINLITFTNTITI